MTRFYIEITTKPRHLVPVNEQPAYFERLADAVYDLNGVTDADLGYRDGLFDFTMYIDDDEPTSALKVALAAVRTAMHAAGDATPGWEKYFKDIDVVEQRMQTAVPLGA